MLAVSSTNPRARQRTHSYKINIIFLETQVGIYIIEWNKPILHTVRYNAILNSLERTLMQDLTQKRFVFYFACGRFPHKPAGERRAGEPSVRSGPKHLQFASDTRYFRLITTRSLSSAYRFGTGH